MSTGETKMKRKIVFPGAGSRYFESVIAEEISSTIQLAAVLEGADYAISSIGVHGPKLT